MNLKIRSRKTQMGLKADWLVLYFFPGIHRGTGTPPIKENKSKRSGGQKKQYNHSALGLSAIPAVAKPPGLWFPLRLDHFGLVVLVF